MTLYCHTSIRGDAAADRGSSDEAPTTGHHVRGPAMGSHGLQRRSLLMTKDTTFQHVGSTLSIPRKHVVGVFDSLQEGEQAVQALVDAGYHVEDIALIPSQDFPSALQEHLRKEGRFRQIMHQLQVTTDEGSLRELLEASARQGSHIITIYVPQREHIDDVSAILFNHGIRLIKYVGNWSIEDLFPPIKAENEHESD